MKPGSYREPLARGAEILSIDMDGVRLALTDSDQPMINVTRCPEITREVILCLEASGGPDLLRAGGAVPVRQTASPERCWAPGELFFKS